jgi:hypothetical protein
MVRQHHDEEAMSMWRDIWRELGLEFLLIAYMIAWVVVLYFGYMLMA